jgi:L-cysteine/cystine lyase
VATSCVPLCSGLATSLDLLAAEGDDHQRLRRIQAGSARLWQGLQQLPGVRTLLPEPPPAGLVSFTIEADRLVDTAELVERLGERGHWIRRLDHPDCLRACLHVTSTAAEIDALLAAIAAQLPEVP